ncbi:MAG: hypothetical protein ACREUK_03525 [Burkholderiales bacterium]
MIMYREASWWYWAVSVILLGVGLAGRPGAFYLTVGLSVLQIAHFRRREGRWSAFPVQVRVAYALIVGLFLWQPLNVMYWLPFIGTAAIVLFGYCLLARCLSLLPWNRREPMSLNLLARTFFSAPVKGNVMQGLPTTP